MKKQQEIIRELLRKALEEQEVQIFETANKMRPGQTINRIARIISRPF